MTLSRLSTGTPPPRNSFSSQRRSSYQSLSCAIEEEDEPDPDFLTHINRFHTLSAAQIDALKRKAKEEEDNDSDSHVNRYHTMSSAQIDNLMRRAGEEQELEELEVKNDDLASFRTGSSDYGSVSSLFEFINTVEIPTQTSVTSGPPTSPEISPASSPEQSKRHRTAALSLDPTATNHTHLPSDITESTGLVINKLHKHTDSDSSSSTISLPTPTHLPPPTPDNEPVTPTARVKDTIYSTPNKMSTSIGIQSEPGKVNTKVTFTSGADGVYTNQPPPPKRTSTLSKIIVQKPPRTNLSQPSSHVTNVSNQKDTHKLLHSVSVPSVSTPHSQPLPKPPARSSSVSQSNRTSRPSPVLTSYLKKDSANSCIVSTNSNTVQAKGTVVLETASSNFDHEVEELPPPPSDFMVSTNSDTINSFHTEPITSSTSKTASLKNSESLSIEVQNVELNPLPKQVNTNNDIQNIELKQVMSNSWHKKPISSDQPELEVELKRVNTKSSEKAAEPCSQGLSQAVELKKVDPYSREKPPEPKKVDNTRYRTTAITKAAIFGTVSVRVRPRTLEREHSSENGKVNVPKPEADRNSDHLDDNSCQYNSLSSSDGTNKRTKEGKSKKSKKSSKKKNRTNKKKSSSRDWTCESCQTMNSSSRDYCNQCHMPRKQMWLCVSCDKYNSRSKCSDCKKVPFLAVL